MNVLDYYPALALVAILGGFWGYARIQHRRLQKAVTDVAAQLNGTYKPGGHHSGGTLFVKSGGRDVVFVFNLSHSARNESTSVGTTLARPVATELDLCGREALDRDPRLGRYSRWYAPVKVSAKTNLLSVQIYGVVRRADRLVELASIVSELAARLETP
jgi:hypothetical protein